MTCSISQETTATNTLTSNMARAQQLLRLLRSDDAASIVGN